MPYLESFKDGTLFDIFKQYPQFSHSLHIFLQDAMRGDSPFTVAERELIAGYVSGINKCVFCCSVHTGLAEKLGNWQGLVETFLNDAPYTPENPKLVPVLAYVRKLTQDIDATGQEDIDAILAAGWDEQAVVHANLICGGFNLFNRWVTGLGVTGDPSYVEMTIKQLLAGGYTGVNDMIESVLQRQSA